MSIWNAEEDVKTIRPLLLELADRLITGLKGIVGSLPELFSSYELRLSLV